MAFQNVLFLVFGAFMFLMCLYLLQLTKKGRVFDLRRLPVVDAIDEAVGRAKEMNRPVCFIPTCCYGPLETVAASGVLSHIAKLTARTKAHLDVLNQQGAETAGTIMEDVVRTSYAGEGCSELYDRASMIKYLGSVDQFAADSIAYYKQAMPAAMVEIGPFYAFTQFTFPEIGSEIGAITIGGCINISEASQTPLYDYGVVCDEVYALSAYLTKNPLQAATLIAGDVIKYVSLALLIICAILTAAGFPVADWILQ